ncbi:manganese efflux pump MntP family protein [Paenibacillus sp. KQZ6P-2]|uniref:Putative manganese efflux pump MntP n=1 Tax=Paenibacillus mangrovi TaxID=2931978 RepID=A0A9X1WQH3_9BACL|nr:manganese efflux pump MntP family protein [Paenibacillus mangrovi]MCJ8012806.1 manganese efflux pump MntP family protein [Paenibacillus mangrovi]
MFETSASLGQLITILIMAAALGMDAFSLGVGIGMKGIRLLHVIKISVLIGFFHILMPLFGMFTGQYVSSLLGQVTTYAAGGLLILLGAHMVLSSTKSGETRMIDHRSLIGMILFSLSVSVDSFSVGVSLGMFQSNLIFTVLAFGICGAAMSVMGLLLGRRVSRNLGDFGEALGGVILLGFGLTFIF